MVAIETVMNYAYGGTRPKQAQCYYFSPVNRRFIESASKKTGSSSNYLLTLSQLTTFLGKYLALKLDLKFLLEHLFHWTRMRL